MSSEFVLNQVSYFVVGAICFSAGYFFGSIATYRLARRDVKDLSEYIKTQIDEAFEIGLETGRAEQLALTRKIRGGTENKQ